MTANQSPGLWCKTHAEAQRSVVLSRPMTIVLSDINRLVYDISAGFDGIVPAEYGIGETKKPVLDRAAASLKSTRCTF
jgi:hypothetical protein